MRARKLLNMAAGMLLFFGIIAQAFADERSYVWTYEYMTMPKGMWELEYYLTLEAPNIHKSNINTIKPWIELEYGISDNWDAAIYQMWKFENKRFENDSEYDGFKIRTRYRFGQKGQFIVDPLIYFEYIRDDDLHQPNVGEAKLILAKDIGDVNISYNQILKINLEKEGKTGYEYAAGISYKFMPNFKLGLESKGNYSKGQYAAGPVFSFSSRHFWISAGTVFGFNEKTDDIQARLIVGIPF